MTTYGFRLFDVELFKGNGRTRLAFSTDSWSYSDHLLKAIQSVEGQTFRGSPAGQPDDEPDPERWKKHPVLTVISGRRIGPAVLGSIRYGRDSDFENAVPNDPNDARGDSIDIADTAPTRTYRFLFLPPATPGVETAMLAVESVGRACPSRPFVRWSKRWSQNYSETDGRTKDGDAGDWHRVKIYGTVDPKALRDHLQDSTVVEMELRSARKSKARREKSTDFSLTSRLDGAKERALDKLSTAITSKLDEEEFAKELAGLVGVDAETLDLEEGWLLINTPGVGNQKVSVSHLPEIFTYATGDRRLDDNEFLSVVKRRLSLIPGAAATAIDRDGW